MKFDSHTDRYAVRDYKTGEQIGTADLTPEQFDHFLQMAQQPQGIMPLGDMPRGWYRLQPEFQGTPETATIYLD